jgi:hypothetical protein
VLALPTVSSARLTANPFLLDSAAFKSGRLRLLVQTAVVCSI